MNVDRLIEEIAQHAGTDGDAEIIFRSCDRDEDQQIRTVYKDTDAGVIVLTDEE